jgi:hypothetical protein
MSASRESFEVFRLFQRVVPPWFLRELCQRDGYRFRQGVYNAGVVMWLMIWQRLQGNRSLEGLYSTFYRAAARGCKSNASDGTMTTYLQPPAVIVRRGNDCP